MRKIFLAALAVLAAGCVTIETETVSTGTFPKDLKAISHLRQARTGMTVQEVRSLLDEQVIIGYEQAPDGQSYVPVTLNNPYRIETVQKGGLTYEIYYYFSGVKQPDGLVADDELVPLVFEDGKLVGKGWPYLNHTVRGSA
ncbi:MAG: hypothetical protein Q8Q08_06165 [Candidatus Omnitrophota bacterium]|nr:hypothetical protein [Candidatus Omnitrophota bacterium]MDZ4242041.1 hypothetical protein [Candidatus Omnitrophota bacterium]